MRRFIEKSFIILFCLYNTYKINPSIDLVIYFLISLICSLALDLFTNKKYRLFIYLFFIILCFTDNFFVFYLPLILYNIYLDFNIYSLLALILILINFSPVNLVVSIISIYLSIMTKEFNLILHENKITRDTLKEDALYLKRYNEQLKMDREKNIHIAILLERNRIARELHDSIGHSISSSILQVEALKVISNSTTLESLNMLQATLKNGMNDIRESIHNLYNESFDLQSKIENLCNEIPSIQIELIFKIEEQLDFDLKFDILSIVKEGITNCVKHSNATKLEINLLSQPKFYSIILKDNGSQFDNVNPLLTKGIGLASINEIATKYKGFLNYGFDSGFKLHITLMKG